MRSHLQTLLAILVVLILGFIGFQVFFGPDNSVKLTLTSVDGEVLRTDVNGDSQVAAEGSRLFSNDQLTVGTNGHAVISVDEQTQLTLEADSSIRVLAVDTRGIRVELEDGRVQARVRPGSPSLNITNRGRAVTSTDADFTVATDNSGTLVAEASHGSLSLQGFDSLTQVSPGERLNAMSGQGAVLGEITEDLLLEVQWPEEELTRLTDLPIEGKTAPFAMVEILNHQVRAGADGHFHLDVSLEEGRNDVQVLAQDVMGNSSNQVMVLTLDTQAPTVINSEVFWEAPR